MFIDYVVTTKKERRRKNSCCARTNNESQPLLIDVQVYEKKTDVAAVTSLLESRKQTDSMNQENHQPALVAAAMTSYLRHQPDDCVDREPGMPKIRTETVTNGLVWPLLPSGTRRHPTLPFFSRKVLNAYCFRSGWLACVFVDEGRLGSGNGRSRTGSRRIIVAIVIVRELGKANKACDCAVKCRSHSIPKLGTKVLIFFGLFKGGVWHLEMPRFRSMHLSRDGPRGRRQNARSSASSSWSSRLSCPFLERDVKCLRSIRLCPYECVICKDISHSLPLRLSRRLSCWSGWSSSLVGVNSFRPCWGAQKFGHCLLEIWHADYRLRYHTFPTL